MDIPWRPADLEQRAGHIIRQGNENKNVSIYRYVTKGTFDAYSYQTLENKQKFISQIMTSKEPAKAFEDAVLAIKRADVPMKIGEFQGFPLSVTMNSPAGGGAVATMQGAYPHMH